MTSGSVGPAVLSACDALREKVIALVVRDEKSPLRGFTPAQVTIDNGMLISTIDTQHREELSAFLGRRGSPVVASGDAAPGPEQERYAAHSYGAVFAEVLIDPDLGVIRVPRIAAGSRSCQTCGGSTTWSSTLMIFGSSVIANGSSGERRDENNTLFPKSTVSA